MINNNSFGKIVIPLLAIAVTLLIAMVGWGIVARDKVVGAQTQLLQQQIDVGSKERLDINRSLREMQTDLREVQLDIRSLQVGQELLLKEIKKAQ